MLNYTFMNEKFIHARQNRKDLCLEKLKARRLLDNRGPAVPISLAVSL